MNVEIRTEVAQFPEKDFPCSVVLYMSDVTLLLFLLIYGV
jgi:hypothetical protein